MGLHPKSLICVRIASLKKTNSTELVNLLVDPRNH